MSTKQQLPRFDYQSRRPSPDALVRPLAPPLLELVSDTDEAKRHEQIAQRYSEGKTRLVATGEKLATAEREDAERERAALEKGGAVPKEKAPGLREQLERARRDVAILSDLLTESADALLAVAASHFAAATERAERDAELALEEARDLLAATEQAFERAAELTGTHGWLSELNAYGVAPPFSPRRSEPAPKSAGLVRQATHVLPEERELTVERRAKLAQEREHESARLVPGTLVWRGSESYLVGEDGELEKVER